MISFHIFFFSKSITEFNIMLQVPFYAKICVKQTFSLICYAKKKGPQPAPPRTRRQSPVHLLSCERKFESAINFLFAAQRIKSRYSIKKTLHNLTTSCPTLMISKQSSNDCLMTTWQLPNDYLSNKPLKTVKRLRDKFLATT